MIGKDFLNKTQNTKPTIKKKFTKVIPLIETPLKQWKDSPQNGRRPATHYLTITSGVYKIKL